VTEPAPFVSGILIHVQRVATAGDEVDVSIVVHVTGSDPARPTVSAVFDIDVLSIEPKSRAEFVTFTDRAGDDGDHQARHARPKRTGESLRAGAEASMPIDSYGIAQILPHRLNPPFGLRQVERPVLITASSKP
jgi:hypothetical protein